MGESNVNLASLIGSRICHDLISPIGAITNGLELLDMAGAVAGPELELISDSVGNAGARIRFFRIAYGTAGNEPMSPTEIASVLNDATSGGRLKVDWGPAKSLPRSEVRLAFLAIQCLETAMPYGGSIHVDQAGPNWTVSGLADKLNVDSGLWCALNGVAPMQRITPALVQFALLPTAAEGLGRAITFDQSATEATIRF